VLQYGDLTDSTNLIRIIQLSQLLEKLKSCSHQLIADIIDALSASLLSDEAQVLKGALIGDLVETHGMVKLQGRVSHSGSCPLTDFLPCDVCRLHGDRSSADLYEIGRTPLWILRHHPDPAPLVGWLLLDARRHVGGPVGFNADEAADWGCSVQQACRLIKHLTGCDRVYAIAFGEGASHLHLHLIPRSAAEPSTEAWAVADLYRAVTSGERKAADAAQVFALVHKGRQLWPSLESRILR
jgi:diadenosine tetraphosphate (Ap4A) HIT family hydrolase